MIYKSEARGAYRGDADKKLMKICMGSPGRVWEEKLRFLKSFELYNDEIIQILSTFILKIPNQDRIIKPEE